MLWVFIGSACIKTVIDCWIYIHISFQNSGTLNTIWTGRFTEVRRGNGRAEFHNLFKRLEKKTFVENDRLDSDNTTIHNLFVISRVRTPCSGICFKPPGFVQFDHSCNLISCFFLGVIRTLNIQSSFLHHMLAAVALLPEKIQFEVPKSPISLGICKPVDHLF